VDGVDTGDRGVFHQRRFDADWHDRVAAEIAEH
jgi:hypothetical protein